VGQPWSVPSRGARDEAAAGTRPTNAESCDAVVDSDA